MSEDKTGGPAFPTNTAQQISGMTLRDYFAARASDEDISYAMSRMPKIERVLQSQDGQKQIIYGLPEDARQIARYMCADAMLKAR